MLAAVSLSVASAADDVDPQALARSLAGPAGCFDIPYVASGVGGLGSVAQRGTARFEGHTWTMASVDYGLRLEAIGT